MRLFRGDYSRAHESGDTHGADVQPGSGLLLRDPPICLLCLGTVRGDAKFFAEGSHSPSRPILAVVGLDIFSIEYGGDRPVVEYFAERINHCREILHSRGRTASVSGDSQRRVMPASPMNDQNHFVACRVDVDDDFFDQSAHDLFLQNHVDSRMIPDPPHVPTESVQFPTLLWCGQCGLATIELCQLILLRLNDPESVVPFLSESGSHRCVSGVSLFVLAGRARLGLTTGFESIHNQPPALLPPIRELLLSRVRGVNGGGADRLEN